MSQFVDACASGDVREGQSCVVRVEGRDVALVRVDGQVYAVDNVCPHRAGELGRGDLEGYHLSCPLHAWCFDVRDGVAFFPQGVRLECFDVHEVSGRISVRLRVASTNAE